MKKIYIKPACDTYKVANNNLLQASPDPGVDPSQGTGDMDAKGTNLFNFGDDEE